MVLLINYYWFPYNNSGTFRWLGFDKYIEFDVLTSKCPVESFVDYTIPKPKNRVIKKIGRNWRAKIWGLIAPLFGLFKKYDWVIFSSPPEPLIIWAWIYQLLGKRVLLDMRDMYQREALRGKFMIPIYRFCYKRVKNVIVAFQFSDPTKQVVYHGYDDIRKNRDALKEPIYIKGRFDYATYNTLLGVGVLPDLSDKPEGYACSSIHNIKHLGYEPNSDRLHPEVYQCKPQSWREGAKILKNILWGHLNNNNCAKILYAQNGKCKG